MVFFIIELIEDNTKMIVGGGGRGVAFRRISQTSNQYFIRIYTPKRQGAAFFTV